MTEYATTLINGKEEYVNDVLVDLPYHDKNAKDFVIIVDGVTFTLSPSNANEFCMDYSSDTYSQQIIGGSGVNELRYMEPRCGFVKEVKAPNTEK